MKKHNIRMFAAILAFCGVAIMFASCSKNKIPAGLYYDDYSETGTIEGRGSYDYVIQGVELNEDGTGTWWKFFFAPDDHNEPFTIYGGEMSGDGHFTFSYSNDNIVTAHRETNWGPENLVFRYNEEVLITEDEVSLYKVAGNFKEKFTVLEQSLLGNDTGIVFPDGHGTGNNYNGN